MPHKPKATKKPYRAPSFRRLEANTAKVALETTAAPKDGGARAMLNSIGNSKAEPRSTTSESNRQS
jgi:hypothetical protein